MEISPNGFLTRFKLGNHPWNKGKKMSEEFRNKCSLREKLRVESGISNCFKKGHQTSQETRNKISQSNKGREAWNNGISCKEETKEKLSIALKGRKCPWAKNKTPEQIRKQKESLKKSYLEGKIISYNKGKHLSEETKTKISESLKGNEGYWLGKSRDKQTNLKISATKKSQNKKHSLESKRNLRIKALKHIEKTGSVAPFVGKNEKYILDQLEDIYKLKIIRQYKIEKLGFFIDGYIKEINLAIEVDEPLHNKHKEKVDIRQKEIQKELNCKFLRIKDKY
jgi:hypothetical protein